MDYEKKYKEAINVAQQHPNAFVHDIIEQIFPELAESEDEKIRKELLVDIPKVFPHDKAFKYISYLEKQGVDNANQRPIDWHLEDERNLKVALSFIEDEALRKWLKDIIHNAYDNLEYKSEQESNNKPYPETLEKAIELYYFSYGNGHGGFDNLSLEKFKDIVKTFVEDYAEKKHDK